MDGLAQRLRHWAENLELIALAGRSGEAILCRATRRTDPCHWQLEEISLGLTPDFRASLMRLWRLTPTEAEIAEALLRGDTADGIAARTGRTPGTVRQLVKVLLGKLQVHSQAQAVARLAVIALAHVHTAEPRAERPVRRQHACRDATGNALVCWWFGEPGGVPVLFFHGALFGIAARSSLPAEARLLGVDVLAPERPGYGETPLPAGADPVALAVERARAALDLEGMDRVQLLAHDVGTAYAFAFARAHPRRVGGIVCAPATPPMTGWAQTADMPPLHRISAFAAQKSPALMEAMIRLGLRRIEREGLRAIPRLVFADSAHDRAVLLRPEACPVLEALYLSVTGQHAAGFLQDMFVTNRDWSAWLSDIRCPVRFLHGGQSRTVSEDTLRGVCESLADVTLAVVPDAGNTIPITHPAHAFRQALLLDGARGAVRPDPGDGPGPLPAGRGATGSSPLANAAAAAKPTERPV